LKSWTLTIDDEGVLPLPEDLLEAAGWQEGDHLNWIDNKDGTWSIIKEEDLTNFLKKGIINDEQN
jgi:bifunctional DNA-binding transcriptional regulator/antitoxin component of YhaV-PrlF toxin-antitoxin module